MNGKLIATGVICFALGFFFKGLLPVGDARVSASPNLTTQSSTAAVQLPTITQAGGNSNSTTPTQTTSNNSAAHFTNSSSKANNLTEIPETTPNKNTSDNLSGKSKLKFSQRTEISDESIDELVPKPFNNSVKHLQPDIKEKFSRYLSTENQNDSDIQAERFLNDALNQGQLAGIAEVNFIGCKAGLCEVRLFEQTPNQTMPTIFKQLTPYGDYFQDATSSMTSDGQQTYIHYVINLKH